MKIAINQANYLPWLPYFHLISYVDKFYFLDNVRAANGSSFINRNQLTLNNKTYWITVTIKKNQKKKYLNETIIEKNFIKSHLDKFYNYSRNDKYFEDIYNLLEESYNINKKNTLSEFNIYLIKSICKYLNIRTKFFYATDIVALEKVIKLNLKGEDIVKIICKESKCNELYNFSKGIDLKLKPFDKNIFFQNNSIKLYKQNLNKFMLEKELIFKCSIIQLLAKFGKKIINEKIITYDRIY
jgi:hypothetical protein